MNSQGIDLKSLLTDADMIKYEEMRKEFQSYWERMEKSSIGNEIDFSAYEDDTRRIALRDYMIDEAIRLLTELKKEKYATNVILCIQHGVRLETPGAGLITHGNFIANAFNDDVIGTLCSHVAVMGNRFNLDYLIDAAHMTVAERSIAAEQEISRQANAPSSDSKN